MLAVKLPRFDVNDDKVYIAAIYSIDGDKISKNMPLLEIETTKVTETIFSCETGIIKLLVSEGDLVAADTVVYLLFETNEEYLEYCCSLDTKEPAENRVPKATKKARKRAEELGINLENLCISGIIQEQHVEDYAEQLYKKSSFRKPAFNYDRERVVIIGAGKGAEVVLDILLDDPNKYVVGLVDDHVTSFAYFNIPVVSKSIMNFPQEARKAAFDSVIVSLGSNLRSMEFRAQIYEYYRACDLVFTNAVSKSAEIRRFTKIGRGNIIGSRVYIGTTTFIGNNNCISYGAMIGHHNLIGDHNLLGPNIVTSGSVEIGSNCIISAGVTFINKVSIGNNVILPVNFAVNRDLEDKTFVQISNGDYKLKTD